MTSPDQEIKKLTDPEEIKRQIAILEEEKKRSGADISTNSGTKPEPKNDLDKLGNKRGVFRKHPDNTTPQEDDKIKKATPEQLKELRSWGYNNPTDLSFEQAKELIRKNEEKYKPKKRTTRELTPEEQEAIKLETTEAEKKELDATLGEIPKKEKKSLLGSLLSVGFRVDKLKNNLLASATQKFAKKNSDQDGLTTRFVKELNETFKRKAKDSEKKEQELSEGKGGWKTNLTSPAILAFTILKYGRIITDITGKTATLPFRYVTMAGMALTSLSEAGKEAHLKSEEASKKTRRKNRQETEKESAERSAKEAWALYEEALTKSENGKISGEELQNLYVSKLPEDLLRRLQGPRAASDLLERFFKWDFGNAVKRLDKSLKKIDANSKYTPAQKEKAKKDLLNNIQWKNALRDYDRMFTEFGTIDELAAAAIYMKAVGRGMVGGAMTVSLARLWQAISEPHLSEYIEKQTPEQNGDTTDTTKSYSPTETRNKIPPQMYRNQVTDSTPTPQDAIEAQTEATQSVDIKPEINAEAAVPSFEEHREISRNFSVKLGEGDVPKNLETAYNEIAANNIVLLPGRMIDEEFATKSLNVAANLVRLTEGDSVAGINASDFGRAVSFKNGVLEIKDYESFNKILDELNKHSNKIWENGTLRAPGAAIAYIPKISREGWLDIARAKGLTGDLTGMTGHSKITLEQIEDFSKGGIVRSSIETAKTAEMAANAEAVAQKRAEMGLPPQNPTPTNETTSSVGATSTPVIETMGSTVQNQNSPINNPAEYRGYNSPVIPETQDGFGKFEGYQNGANGDILENNPLNLPEGLWRDAENVFQKHMEFLKQKTLIAGNPWERILTSSAKEMLAIKPAPDGTYGVVGTELHKLQDLTRVQPKGWNIFKPAETVEQYIRRALQTAAAQGNLERIRTP